MNTKNIQKGIPKNNLEEKINENFTLPIEFNDKKHQIYENLKNDLELIKSNENNKSNDSFYKKILNPQTIVGEKIMEKWSNYYTSDEQFLKDNQKLYSNTFNINCDSCNELWKSWKTIKNDNNFYDKYIYLPWDKVKFLNQSSIFLFIFSVYSLLSPLLNILAPFIILIIPFFILKIMKIPINCKTYVEILKIQLNKQLFGRLFTDFNSINIREKVYSILCFSMYLYNIYQNFVSFIEFKKNVIFISKFFNKIHEHLKNTSNNIALFLKKTENLISYTSYNQYIKKENENIKKILNELKDITIFKYNLKSFKNIGYIFKKFYSISKNIDIEKTLLFSFGFNGYLDNINGLNTFIKNKEMNKCTFTTKKNIIHFKDCYLPNIESEKIVKNTINLKKNLILTGPNASGKTTLIKTALLNILLIQQTGFGFFSKGKISTFDYLHCYINIPDTSSRDSLFQAEARRCNKILNIINNNPKSNHLCIFDELYSGTNPDEAIASAYSYLEYFSKNKNVKFLLTTHFIKVCKLFNENNNVKNYKMDTIINKENDNLEYTYKIKSGISEIKGGIYVLKQLNFPQKLIEKTKDIIKTL